LNNEDVRYKFSVVSAEFRIIHPEVYGYIDRSTLNSCYYCMFNKFDDKEDIYYLKYLYCPGRTLYDYVEKSPFTKNYQHYRSVIDKGKRLQRRSSGKVI
jgi:hypothetical protein